MLGLRFIGWFWSSPSWNGALICHGHAVLQLLGGSSTVRTGAFSRRSKKAEAQQLALKINVRRNPAALRLAADCFYGRKIFQYPKDMMRKMCSASLSAE